LKKILVLGIGNDILTDDGIGPKLLTDLQKENFSENIDFKKLFLGGLEIIELIQGYEQVIFIDAVITANGVPGTVYHYTPDDFNETLHLSNLHDANFLTALELGRKMNMKIPSRIDIIAIEILEDRVFSDRFTPEIEKKYPDILKAVTNLIRIFL
jgi:hydrogenase maturation protease